MEGICQETAGFLFKHPCDSPAVQQCVACNKSLCQDHAHYLDNEIHCTTCVRADKRRQVREARERGSRNSLLDQRSTHYGSFADDPYFYSDAYFHGYGRYGYGHWGFGHYQAAAHEAHDFTEGDAESLAQEGDEDFESSFGES